MVNADSDYCESCGARLKPATEPPQAPLQILSRPPAKAATRPKKIVPPRQKDKKKRPHVEPWQVITGVVVFVFASFFVYTEFLRPESSPPATNQQQGLGAPSPGMLQEIDELQRIVDANPTDTSSLLRLANLLNDAGMTNSTLLMRAVNMYTKYLALKPDDPNARVDMGICYFQMSRMDTENARSLIDRAIKEMETAFTTHPTHQPAAFNLGIVHLNAGDFEESTKWFKKAVEINPNSELGKKAQHLLEEHPPQGPPN
jgi:cytochrome c-type biogenesis protein CcmH/NrfG